MDSIAVVLVFTVVCCAVAFSSQHMISVDAVNGHNKPSCLLANQHPCKTLEYVQSQLNAVATQSVVIEICEPGINLSRALNFSDFRDLTIRGEQDSRITCITSNAGLSFINVTGLSLDSIWLLRCGAVQRFTTCTQNTQQPTAILVTALFMFICSDVTISDSVICRSNGTGISMLDTYGNVVIERTSVLESKLDVDPFQLVYGGNGLLIAFSPSIYTSHNACPLGQEFVSNAIYNILNCTFSANNANRTASLHSKLCSLYDKSGGASIEFGQNSTGISVNFDRSVFKDNYSRTCGAGLTVFKSIHDNRVTVTRTTFLNNHTPQYGGGFQLIVYSYSHKTNGKISFRLCQFINNSAVSGGAVNIYSNNGIGQKIIEFTSCSWTGNSGVHGSAVHLMQGMQALENLGGHSSMVTFTNCTLSGNRVIPATTTTQHPGVFQTQVNGAGAVFSYLIFVEFCGKTTFVNNTGTALHLTDSTALFQASSTVVFINNYGMNGGGISLVGHSYLYLNGSSNFSFINNTATELGGGIYFQATHGITYQPCFIYTPMNTGLSTFNFSGNHALSQRGNHIFASAYSSCTLSCHGYIYDCIGLFIFSDPADNATATLPTNFSLKTEHRVMIFPGLPLRLPLNVTDYEGNKVYNLSYQASVVNSSQSASIDSAFQYVSANTIALLGKEGKNVTVRLDATSGDNSLLINVTLADCPPGYVHIVNRCVCNAEKYYGMVKCDPNALIRHGIWMGKCGKHNSSTFCTSDCPIAYCTNKRALPMNGSSLENEMCAHHKAGIICGSCKHGYSVYYNSWGFVCGDETQCHLGFLYFILSTIIPLTILLIIITLLDLNFAKGWYGFILFSQMVNSFTIYGNDALTLSNTQLHIIQWLLFTYSFFSLEVFNINKLSFCIWKGATVMDVLVVKLGSICYALALVMVTVYVLKQRQLTKYFPCLLRRRYTVINGISTFLILCYAQCARTCFQLLVTGCLYDKDYKCSRQVVFFSGDMEPFQGPHLKYAAVAVTFLVLIVILPPTLLLMYPLLFRSLRICKLSETRIVMCLWRMMPIQLLDSFQNAFKDKYRFFAGLYFLYRTIPLAIYVITKNLVPYFSCLELTLGIMMALHAALQPYKIKRYNLIDLMLFLNLMVINGITFYNYISSIEHNYGSMELLPFFWIWIQIVLLALPLITVGLITTRNIVIHFKSPKPRDAYRAIETVT